MMFVKTKIKDFSDQQHILNVDERLLKLFNSGQFSKVFKESLKDVKSSVQNLNFLIDKQPSNLSNRIAQYKQRIKHTTAYYLSSSFLKQSVGVSTNHVLDLFSKKFKKEKQLFSVRNTLNQQALKETIQLAELLYSIEQMKKQFTSSKTIKFDKYTALPIELRNKYQAQYLNYKLTQLLASHSLPSDFNEADLTSISQYNYQLAELFKQNKQMYYKYYLYYLRYQVYKIDPDIPLFEQSIKNIKLFIRRHCPISQNPIQEANRVEANLRLCMSFKSKTNYKSWLLFEEGLNKLCSIGQCSLREYKEFKNLFAVMHQFQASVTQPALNSFIRDLVRRISQLNFENFSQISKSHQSEMKKFVDDIKQVIFQMSHQSFKSTQISSENFRSLLKLHKSAWLNRAMILQILQKIFINQSKDIMKSMIRVPVSVSRN
ncbi:MAG: hypothetical protein OXF85_03200 [Candidatus Saccharibacteria bacterium]|nr:hypothetical protein [Candidatus Saccharibacteria bacterium]